MILAWIVLSVIIGLAKGFKLFILSLIFSPLLVFLFLLLS
jgi:hypothetical protein